jgi:hypothetical protein
LFNNTWTYPELTIGRVSLDSKDGKELEGKAAETNSHDDGRDMRAFGNNRVHGQATICGLTVLRFMEEPVG